MVSWGAAAAITAFRVANSLFLSTFFQPDEYFQAFEPAHLAVYGSGVLTWEWRFGLRGCIIPVIYSYLFRIADLSGADRVIFCRIFQGLVAAVGDLYTFKLARRLEGPLVAKYALIASLGSAFYYFCGTRPFSNTFEMVCCTVALYNWPWKFASYRQLLKASVWAHLAIIMRPTNALLWIVLGLQLLWQNPNQRLKIALLSLALALAIHTGDYILDNWYYGFSVWPLGAFISANIGEKASHHYGVMPLHFYFSSALPILALGYLPVVLYGLATEGKLSWLVLSQISVYSFLAHKEFRFIFYLLPLIHIIFAKTLLKRGWKKMLWVGLAVNAIAAGYLGHVHQRGVLDVAEYVRGNPEIQDITFLMPCHSIPGYAHFSRETQLKIHTLSCDPPVVVPLEDRAGYVDEADQFYLDPPGFLRAHPEKLTEHIAIFQALHVPDGYTEIARFFNSHFHDDARRVGDVVVYQRSSAL